jgi:hypothetical protein
LTHPRPWLYRMVQAIRRSWTGETPPETATMNEYTPDKVVMVTFDDGLRNSFRYGGNVAADLGIAMTMFVGVGDVLSGLQRYIASFAEIREFMETGGWEIQSLLWDAGEPQPVSGDEKPRLVLPISNLLWKPDRERMESLREYQTRLRREFRDSKRVLARELNVETDDVFAVAYPVGDVGQENYSNIRAFRVPEVVLNEAEINYRMGFIQYEHGYTIKTDDPLLYKRWEPDRNATGRDVLRAAYYQHPVFTARRMRAEMAALNGRTHMAQENIELLRRDGYPDEDLADLQEVVRRHTATLAVIPEALEDQTEAGQQERLVFLHRPYIGIQGRLTRANEMIDEREASLFGGFNLNRRAGLEVQVGRGRIRQTVRSNTVVEVERTSVNSDSVTEQRIENGVVTNEQINRTTVSTITVQSNEVERFSYAADTTRVGVGFNYIHDSGSFSLAHLGYHVWDGNSLDNESFFSLVLEHQWRPMPALDLVTRYHRSAVPSARSVIEYDSVALRPFWRIRDGWEMTGLGYFAYYQDKNSFLKTELENFWCLSHRNDVWLGLSHMLDTVDRESDLYWTPFWEQRHMLIARIRRSYPNFFGMVRAHVGMVKSQARQADRDAYNAARAQGDAQGWSPGSNPQRGWQKMVGFEASLVRTFASGWQISTEFSVNAADEYTEHSAMLRFMYAF